MKFLLEILGMTNACNLNCDYCDWEKKTKRKLTEKDLKNAEKYLTNIRNVILKKHPEIQLIEYSGGEPSVYPEIVELILRVFSDKWIRIISNGTLINNQQIEMLKKHKNLFIALSCDGNTIEANKPRVHNNEIIFQNILQTIDNLVKNNIPVMILCTLNKANMRLFPEFCYYLKEKYHDSISNGMLVLPAHCVTSYSHDNGSADKDMRVEFKNYLVNLEKDSIISGIFEHYHELANYLLNDTHITKCHVPEWTVSIHFRNDNIVTNGNFISFDCGMRGINEIG